MKHFTIPIFVPELACPNRCVFCNQNSISGCAEQPGIEEVEQIIGSRLRTIPNQDSYIEIGFFGGNFTGIEESLQRSYLTIAHKYLKSGAVQGIRCSTRPDYIDSQALSLLKEYGVTTIELGAQSLNEEVLKLAGRGHSVEDIERASGLILKHGFKLGLQMMTGLPGDTAEKSNQTAKKIIELGADNTRIYPTLVIKETKLAELWKEGVFKPQSLDEAVSLSATLIEIFKEAGVKVIRVGLHPSEELLAGGEMLAGPYHPNFRQLAESEVWRRRLQLKVQEYEHFKQGHFRQGFVSFDKENQSSFKHPSITIEVSEDEFQSATGYQGSNKKMLEQYFNNVIFNVRETSDSSKPLIIADKRLPLPAKNTLRNLGKVIFLEDQIAAYKSISGHPDIYICDGDKDIVVAPCLDPNIKVQLIAAGYKIIEGKINPGRKYPETAVYNAVVTGKLLVHNLKITDPVILNTFQNKEHIHVKQGYTRCNLIPLNEEAFITSDKGIERALLAKGYEILYVDPLPVMLKGQKHGFFPGCCGIWDNKMIISGSLHYHPAGREISDFIENHNMQVVSLYNGPLRDIGSIFFFGDSRLNKLHTEKNHHNSTIFEVTNPQF